ncbi:hypothetical protein PUNSTDRAFT_71716, partial [Punctularia strigosozonata HHB-11173 SS5]|uniref:uncharacterized protein n=1 Tax=Punctularia strigosozonata (strain HHB-11173) TaxID=741275 RepID=UPI00044179AA
MAEILCRGTILICSTKHPLKATALSYLGWILFRRFWVTGSAASLDEAIKQQRLALTELHPSQALEKHRHLRYLGSYLFRQYEALNDPGVLEESLTFTAEALRHCTTTHIDRSKSVHDMLRAIVRK